jgi:hypothetical protein
LDLTCEHCGKQLFYYLNFPVGIFSSCYPIGEWNEEEYTLSLKIECCKKEAIFDITGEVLEEMSSE